MSVRRAPMLLVVAALAALAVCVGPAQSAFTGANGRIVFVSDSGEIPPVGFPQIYSINLDGTEQRRLTSSATVDREPAWSPDGSKIAFSRSEAAFANVFVMNADGSGQTNLTNDLTSSNMDPTWSPAGNQIAFVSDRVDSTADIFRINADRTGLVNLTQTPDVREVNPSWSPDGSKIAYDTGGSMWVMNADGTEQTNLTGFNVWGDQQPSWSPSGDRIAFTSDRDSSVGAGEIYVMDADGSGQTRLTTHPDDDSFPQWSPDGTRILFQSLGGGLSPGIYVLDLANRANPPVRLGTQVGAMYPDWQPLPGSFNTEPGRDVVVTPSDVLTGSTMTVTFGEVTAPGYTTLHTSGSGPPPPSGFDVAGVYYQPATTAQFTAAGVEVCVPIVPPAAPTIAQWVGSPPVLETPTTYYRDAVGLLVPPGLGTFACAVVTSFSPFALLDPTASGDTVAPVIACDAADGVWHRANVSIECRAQDGGSGLADPADAAFSLSTSVLVGAEDDDASTGTRQVCDAAGNCATAGPIAGNRIDRKAPALSLPADQTVDATSPAGAVVSYAASAFDGADHPDPGVSCTRASGSVFAIGATTVTCTATDHVENIAQGSFTVTVLGAVEQLARLVQELPARLQSLLAAFDPSNPAQRRAVCTGLSVFAGVVRLLSGRGIPAAQAAAWIADANRIRAVIGC
jgi:HYR domain/WD40-like Beta Propeller Repeat